jgi:hypothetical protein
VHTTEHPKKDDASCPDGIFLITLLIGSVAAKEFWGIVTVIRHIMVVPIFVGTILRSKGPAHEETGLSGLVRLVLALPTQTGDSGSLSPCQNPPSQLARDACIQPSVRPSVHPSIHPPSACSLAHSFARLYVRSIRSSEECLPQHLL